ncbi:MAG: 4-alpha-glucanotransferase [Candidatus Brocadiaceae bacterium]|nr:4-alpha-glucanotransferase [Candidatus Brocadiaceae bacterium]
MNKRRSGILLHITSLPSPHGIGDFGPLAYTFIDFLAEAKQCLWQILPLNPTSTAYGSSPYSSCSAFAGNHIMISPDILLEEGLLETSDLEHEMPLPDERADYAQVAAHKENLLQKAYQRFYQKGKEERYGFQLFCEKNAHWLDDYSLFIALKEHFQGKVWSRWPAEIKYREKAAMEEWGEKLRERTGKERFIQYIFFKQWHKLKDYAHKKNIQIIGDIPIYVTYDSADVWSHPELFKLDENEQPVCVAGVPPDYFSETGQRWGNPIYTWEFHKETGFLWWIKRLEHNLKLFDIVRLDHFRGFVAYWEIPAQEETAVNGKWIEAPVEDFFTTIFKRFPSATLIAEDLGTITPDVKLIMETFEFPGMKLLLFAFGDDIAKNPYAPHNYVKNCVVYTGTHDNNTIKGWFKNEAHGETRKRLSRYLGREVSETNVCGELIRLAMMSIADTVIIPMQDILGLDEEARMNLPATTANNWSWRVLSEQLTASVANEIREITETYGRG